MCQVFCASGDAKGCGLWCRVKNVTPIEVSPGWVGGVVRQSEVICGPIVISAEVGVEVAELAEGVSVGCRPPSAGLLEAGLEGVGVATFDQTGAGRAGRARGRGPNRVGRCGCPDSGARRALGIWVRYVVVLRAGTQRGEDSGVIAGAERLAQRRDKGFGVGWVWSGGGEIIADVKPIDGGAALLAKIQPGLVGRSTARRRRGRESDC